MSREQAPHNDADGRLRTWARLTSVLLTFIGVLGLLRGGVTGPADTVALLVVHPAAAAIYLVAGLVGIALATTVAGRQIAGLAGGAGLLIWGVLGLVLRGSPSTVVTGDRETIALHCLLGAAGLALAMLARQAPAAERST